MARRPSTLDVLRGPAACAALIAALGAGCATAGSSVAATPSPATAPAPVPTATAAAETAPSLPAEARARRLFADGVRLEAAGDLAGAALAFEAAYAADPTLVHAGVNAGVVRERLGEPDAARALYARVLDAAPGCGPAARSLVRLALRRGDVAGAEAEARARLARSPDAAPLAVALVDVLLAAGRLDEAEQEARRALKLDERNVPAMVSLATVYHLRQRNELARMVLENARLVDDRDPTVWNRLGFVDLALGHRAQALEDFRTAAALGPDYPEARANHGALLADAEDFDAAVVELEAATARAPWSAAAWLDLGNAYRGAGRFEQAEAAYRKALAVDPALVEVEFDLAVLYLDGERPGLATLARLEQAVGFLDAFEARGGKDPKVAEYRKDAAKAIEREKKRIQREERDRLRREAEARKKEAAAAAAVEPATATSTATATATRAAAVEQPSTTTTTSTSTSTETAPAAASAPSGGETGDTK